MSLGSDGLPYGLVFHSVVSVVHGLFMGIKIIGIILKAGVVKT